MDYVPELKATVAAIGREYKRLAAWFRAFPEADWKKPTCCTEWNAAKVVGHLAMGGAFFASSVRNALKGSQALPLGAKDQPDFMRIREEMAQEIAELSPAALVERFELNTGDVYGLFSTLKPEDFDRPTWHRRGTFPVRRLVVSRLNELLLHEWDIRNEAERPMTQEPLPLAAGNLRQHFQLFYEMDPVPGLAGTFAFRLTDGKRWAMRVEDKKAVDLGPGDHKADAAFSATGSDMLLLSTGRGSVEGRRKEGRFRVEGDEAKASAIIPKLFFPL
ncbi:MAG: hypothetical protein A3J27_15260 [Candidatus Tectomicrobia bacterium RIFCSPLOWO2_12_FULL_69_37]|nr:MAG: hypothetical protein A3J27_15260 [Candidatus Tectomicrobia bacterium RIFCSPLOWO2_12_FULL_69_37]